MRRLALHAGARSANASHNRVRASCRVAPHRVTARVTPSQS